jgi:hypothetical protein
MQDVKLVNKVSDEIAHMLMGAINDKYDDMTLGDVQGMAEALAMNIIRQVREA